MDNNFPVSPTRRTKYVPTGHRCSTNIKAVTASSVPSFQIFTANNNNIRVITEYRLVYRYKVRVHTIQRLLLSAGQRY